MIVKHAHPRRWTAVDRRTINDEALSFRARGVLVWLLDKPEDWEWRSDTIALVGAEGRDAIRAAVRELEEHGYVERRRVQGESGRWLTETWVYERPEDSAPKTDSQAPVAGNQASVNRASVSQSLSLSQNTDTNDSNAQIEVDCPHGCDHNGWVEAQGKDADAGSVKRCPLHPAGRTQAA